MISNSQLKSLLEISKLAVITAGNHAQQSQNKQLTINKKSEHSGLAAQVVTEIDIQCQDIILKQLSPSIHEFDFGLLAEETKDDASRLEKDYFWCVDPLDGTLPYTEGREGYAVSIALVNQEGVSQLGVVYDPVNQRCYEAIKGMGAAIAPELASQPQDDRLIIYADRSLMNHPIYETVIDVLKEYAQAHDLRGPEVLPGHGAVMNALSVLNHKHAAYFKFRMDKPGGGSIWDFAATTCIYEALGQWVSNAKGDRLHLNIPTTTFMNDQGVLFSSSESLSQYIQSHILNP